MECDYIDLLTLQSSLRQGLEDMFPERIWVKAEISSISVKANGHCYLELSQDGPRGTVAKARAVIWRNVYGMIDAFFREATGESLRSGISVLLRVRVSYSELYGLSLTVDQLDPDFTLGEREMLKRKTIARLEEDGMMQLQKQLSLPLLPYRLAIVSAEGAAGLGDFQRHLNENPYGFAFHTDLFEAAMQGADAPASVIDALDRVESSAEPYDAVLIMRGGGSVLDLDCFNDYDMAVRIATCSLPVFTAIGHDRDHHVADMVAFDFVKTPTALADRFIDCYMAEDERISSYITRLRLAFINKVAAMESRVALLESRIKGADPRGILGRGFSLIADDKGVVMKKAVQVTPGSMIGVMFADGTLECKVEKVKLN